MSLHGDHAACLKEISLTFKLLVMEKIPVLWLKYKLNINKTGIFVIHFYFLFFFNDNGDHGTIFKGRIRFLVRTSIESTLYRYRNSVLTEWKSGLHIADE